MNSSSLLPSEGAALPEELLFPAAVATPSSDFMVPNIVLNSFCVGINNDNEKKKDSERPISAQSIAARERRKKITDKTQEFGKLVPGGPKMNTAEMLYAASKYVKYLQTQIGMLQLMNTLQKEDEVAPPSEDLCALITSPCVQEKLYSEELCFVPKDFVTALTNQRDIRSKPTIFKDLKELIETNNVQKKA
ncbi:transcription factor bHLH52-like [Arachis hypogaea]|uniref:transcription factor bHLH52-like n=1 Tax=Arachis hypogaea TaxID=3818 RepID=UPI000DEC703D|nr:transcription factor bHLH52-like [Arachis hypogaea]